MKKIVFYCDLLLHCTSINVYVSMQFSSYVLFDCDEMDLKDVILPACLLFQILNIFLVVTQVSL